MAAYKPNPYSNVPEAGAPRRTEAWALIEAARRIASTIADGEDTLERKNKRREALRLNWRLWTIFQAGILEDASFPDDLRTNLLTLCQFIDNHTVQALIDPTPEKVAVFIDINRNVASGLLGDPGGDAPRPPQPEKAADQPPTERIRISETV